MQLILKCCQFVRIDFQVTNIHADNTQVPSYQYSCRHVPSYQYSRRHVPSYQQSCRHVPSYQHSCRHVPSYQHSCIHDIVSHYQQYCSCRQYACSNLSGFMQTITYSTLSAFTQTRSMLPAFEQTTVMFKAIRISWIKASRIVTVESLFTNYTSLDQGFSEFNL